MEEVILSLGSNIGDRADYLQKAILLISERVGVIKSISGVYETEPVGFKSETKFLNLCISLDSNLSPQKLLIQTQQIESELGRTEKSANIYTSRKIDIDIIFYGTRSINEENLCIPHPLFQDRKFVLLPLNDLDKDFKDPVTNLTIEQLLINCTDRSYINPIQLVISL